MIEQAAQVDDVEPVLGEVGREVVDGPQLPEGEPHAVLPLQGLDTTLRIGRTPEECGAGRFAKQRPSLNPGELARLRRSERFALFTIIVLGEVVVGVVDGLTKADEGWTTKGVGLLCLGIGFGIWWNYFDFVGRRTPRPGLGVRGLWLVVHLPLAMSVAATGAGMVSLIEHATDDRTPTATAWLIGGSVALLCVSLSVIVSLMPERPGARLELGHFRWLTYERQSGRSESSR